MEDPPHFPLPSLASCAILTHLCHLVKWGGWTVMLNKDELKELFAPIRSGDNLFSSALDEATIEEFRVYNDKVFFNRLMMAKRAYFLRQQYVEAIDDNETSQWTDFWNGDENTVGFWTIWGGTKDSARKKFDDYRRVGGVLNIFSENTLLQQHYRQLPEKMNALVAISRLSLNEIKMCLQGHYTRTSKSDVNGVKDQKKPPVINIDATEASIEKWLDSWRNPKEKLSKDKEPLRVKIAEIYAHADILRVGVTSANDAAALISDISIMDDAQSLVSELKKLTDKPHFRLVHQLDFIADKRQRLAEKDKASDKKKRTKSVRKSKTKSSKR